MIITATTVKRADASRTSAGSDSRRRSGAKWQAVVGAALCLFGAEPWAGDWTLTPRLSVEETYTDNVRQVRNGAEGDFLTTVTPGISLRGTSARLNSNVDYNIRHFDYLDASEFDGTNQQFQASSNLIVVEDWLFFDTSSRLSQQNVDNRSSINSRGRGPNDNRKDVLSYSFAPYVRHAFGSWFTLDARYEDFTNSQSTIDSNAQDDFVRDNSSDEESFNLTVTSGRLFARTPMRFTTSQQKATFETGRVNELKRYEGEVSYVLNRRFRLTANGGHDTNTFESSRGRSNSGPYWSVGGTWTPSPRTNLSGNWGNRFFGNTFNISGSHRHRRLTIDGNYSETVETANNFERQLILVPLVDDFGLPVFDPVTSSQFLVPVDTPTTSDDVLVVKQVSAGMSYLLRRGNLRFRFFQFNRQFQGSGIDELTKGAQLTLNWNLSRRLDWSLTGTWRENTRSTDLEGGSYFTLSPNLNYKVGPHTTARLRYEYTVDDGGGNRGTNASYTENAFSANLVFNL